MNLLKSDGITASFEAPLLCVASLVHVILLCNNIRMNTSVLFAFQKHASDGTPGFEHRLQVMLHRMGVSKTPPAETKMCQVDRVGVCVSVWTQGCAISSCLR